MLPDLYQSIVLKNPKKILLLLIVTLISFGYFAKDFRLDASSETLLIEGDPDLKYLQEISNQVESGEAIFRIVRQQFGESKVPLALQVIESDLLDEEYSGATLAKTNEWRNGVEVDQWGKAVRYSIMSRHPGDAYYLTNQGKQKENLLLPAKDIIHLYMPERPGQNRGVPWFHPVTVSYTHLTLPTKA